MPLRVTANRPGSHCGLTLVELLVSLAILAIAMVGLSQLYLASMQLYLKAQSNSTVAQRLQYEVEKAQSLRFAVLKDTANLIHDARYPAAEGYTLLAGGNGVEFPFPAAPHGHGTVTIAHYQDKPSLLQVTVRIDWRGGMGATSSHAVSTLVVK